MSGVIPLGYYTAWYVITGVCVSLSTMLYVIHLSQRVAKNIEQGMYIYDSSGLAVHLEYMRSISRHVLPASLLWPVVVLYIISDVLRYE